MSARIQILDYGSGNLFSIRDALTRISSKFHVETSSKYRQGMVDGLVLPGVGSFTSAQKILSQNREAILDDLRKRGMPMLGICLGMQLLFDTSEEGPGEGLGIFRGRVKRITSRPNTKVPHMGWNTLELSKESKDSSLCKGLKSGEWVYYVHSFFPVPEDRTIVRAWTRYGAQRFPAVVEQGSVFGTQFHPEKSHDTGAKLISNFARFVLNKSRK